MCTIKIKWAKVYSNQNSLKILLIIQWNIPILQYIYKFDDIILWK